jgi:hypothetical protein
MRRHLAIGVVEDDFALARVRDHPGLEVVRDEPRDRAAEECEHRRMRAQPRLLPHIQRRLHERIPAERQARDEQIHLRDLSRCRVNELHRRPGPVDLDAAAGLMTDPGRRASDLGVFPVKPAEPVITHRRLPGPTAPVEILLVQQLQRHTNPGQLAVHLDPVRLREHALPHPATGKQRQIHLALRLLRNVVPTEPELIRSIDHRLNAVPGHALSKRDRSAGQALVTQLQDELRLDLPYHYRYSFHHVAVTRWKEPCRWRSTTPTPALTSANRGLGPRR